MHSPFVLGQKARLLNGRQANRHTVCPRLEQALGLEKEADGRAVFALVPVGLCQEPVSHDAIQGAGWIGTGKKSERVTRMRRPVIHTHPFRLTYGINVKYSKKSGSRRAKWVPARARKLLTHLSMRSTTVTESLAKVPLGTSPGRVHAFNH